MKEFAGIVEGNWEYPVNSARQNFLEGGGGYHCRNAAAVACILTTKARPVLTTFDACWRVPTEDRIFCFVAFPLGSKVSKIFVLMPICQLGVLFPCGEYPE